MLGDLRFALRGLIARPVFTLVAVLSLALGLGVNTAIYSLFHQVALRPIDGVPDPHPLVNLRSPGPKQGWTSSGSTGTQDEVFSYPMYRDLQQALPEQLVGIAGHKTVGAIARWQEQRRNGDALLVSGNYFALLGLRPSLGRLLDGSDDKAPGDGRVVVLAHAYWQSALGGDPAVIGQSLQLNGETLTIVGVAPPGFRGTGRGSRIDWFVPISLAERFQGQANHALAERKSYWVYLFGRLAPGASLRAAEDALNLPYARLLDEVDAPLLSGLDAAEQAEFRAKRIELWPGARGQDTRAAEALQPLSVLLGVAALVLLIACLNIANLLLARGSARAGEFALRASIGASRLRLLRQLLLEALLIAALGFALSLPLAAAVNGGLLAWLPADAAIGIDAGIDAPAIQFAALATLATVLLFGLFPAWQLARVAPIAVLRSEPAQATSRGGNRFRSVLATAQIGLSMAALVLAGLFAKSLHNLAREDLGMQVESLAVISIAPERNGYDVRGSNQLYAQVEEALVDMPGVSRVATSMVPLLAGSQSGSNVGVEGFNTDQDAPIAYYNLIGPGFFATLGIPLLSGRDFSAADTAGRSKVAVVNQRFVEQYSLGPNPVGKRMATSSGGPLDIEIIGVVANSKYHDVKAAPIAQFFLPWRQQVAVGMNFYVRAAVPPETLLAQLPKVVAQIDPQLSVGEVMTLPQQVARSLTMERLVGLLAAAFAVLATLLAALGLYGVLAFSLAQRMREIGLRLALGAEPRRLARMLLTQVGRMTVLGGVLGLIVAILIGRAAQALLFGVNGWDPVVLSGAALVLAAVAIATGAVPARRAARIQPMAALRHD